MKALRHLLYSRPMTNATPPDDSDVGIVICAAWFHYVCVHYEYLWQILIWLIQQFLASLIRTLNVPAGLARAVMNSLGVGNLCSCLRWASFCLASPCYPCSGSYACWLHLYSLVAKRSDRGSLIASVSADSFLVHCGCDCLFFL